MTAARILLVDDDQDLCEEIAEFLDRAGFPTVIAHDGRQAEERFREQAFALLLVDFKMAGRDGLEVAQRLKQLQPGIRVLMITGRPWAREALGADPQAGMVDDVLGKPFEAETLLSRIRALLAAA